MRSVSTPYLPESSGPEPTAAELSTSRDPRLGIAYAVSVRTEGGGENSLQQVVLTYRLKRLGPDGRELPVLQVEMRGRKLEGMIADGDLVQAAGPLPPSGAIQLETVANLTTGAPVTLMRPKASKGCLIAFLIVVALMVLVMIGLFVGFLVSTS